MALRIKSRWHDDESERSLEEIAGALAFISWRIAKDKAINLHGEDFVYETDSQLFAALVDEAVVAAGATSKVVTRINADDLTTNVRSYSEFAEPGQADWRDGQVEDWSPEQG